MIVSEDDNVELVVEVKQEIDADAIEQLKSYLIATDSTAGAVVSGHELRAFRRIGTKLYVIDDLPIYGEQPSEPITELALLKETIVASALTESTDPIEHFERISQTSTSITVQGRTHTFHNKDLSNLRLIQQRFIVDGVVFGTTIKKHDWHEIIGAQFSRAATPPPNVPDIEIESNQPDELIDEPAPTNTAATLPVPFDPIESFQRLNRHSVQITIKDHLLRFTNAEVTDLKRVRQRFIESGVMFGANLSKPDWLKLIEARFNSTSLPTTGTSESTAITATSDVDSTEGLRCLAHICKQVVTDNNGRMDKNSIYDLIMQTESTAIDARDYSCSLLKRFGIIVKDGNVLIANDHSDLRRLMRDSSWPTGWGGSLRTVKSAGLTKTMRFGAQQSRATSIPLSEIKENSLG